MVLVRCTGCLERNQPKYAQVTFSWRRADNVRVAYRARLCNGCWAQQVAPLDRVYDGTDRLTCPNCGIDTEDDMDPIYTTSFLPEYGKFTTESPFCASCAAIYRIWVLDHAELLSDTVQGPPVAPGQTSAEEVLRALGIVDPERYRRD